MCNAQPYLLIGCQDACLFPLRRCLPCMHAHPTSSPTSFPFSFRSCIRIQGGCAAFSHAQNSEAKGLSSSHYADAFHASMPTTHPHKRPSKSMGGSEKRRQTSPLLKPQDHPSRRQKPRQEAQRAPFLRPKESTTKPFGPSKASRGNNHGSPNPQRASKHK